MNLKDVLENYYATYNSEDAERLAAFYHPEVTLTSAEGTMEGVEAILDTYRYLVANFVDRMTPEAIGDYVAGPNHVLPTGRRARFASGLSVLDFMKRTSFIALDDASLAKIGPAAVSLAHAEGLPAHAKSVELRLK